MKYIFGLLVAIFSANVLYPQETEVLFFPGLFEYEHQAACYTTNDLKTPRGSLVLDRHHAGLFPGSNVSICKFSEIVEPTSSNQPPLSFNRIFATCLAPLSWLSRTVFSSFWDWYRAKSGRTFSGDSHFYKIDLVRTDIAGPGDIAEAAKTLNKAKNRRKKQLVFGVSRGSAAAFIALSKINDYKPSYAIFESAFAEFDDTLPQSPWPKRAFFKALYTLLPKHDEAAIQFVDTFHKEVPVLFVTSKKDKIVPAHSVERLATALAKRNERVYLLKLENSSHKGYSWENSNDKELYEKVAGSFLQKYQHNSRSEVDEQFLELYRVTNEQENIPGR